MYYAVLRKEIKMPCSGGELTLKVGGVYELRKHYDDVYGVFTTQYRSIDTLGLDDDSKAVYGPWEEMSVEDARDTYFVRYYTDLNDAMEESFLVCEATYC